MVKSFILDSSISMSWCFEDEADEYSEQVLRSLNEYKAIVPSLWILEVTNVLLTAEKHNRLNTADSVRFLQILDSLPVYISDCSFTTLELLGTARNYNLTSYDAMYLLLAMHEGLSMATKDKALINACNSAGVNIFNPVI